MLLFYILYFKFIKMCIRDRLGRISSAVNGLIYSIPSMNACYENVSAANQYEESTDLRKVGVNDENKLEFNEKVEIRNVSWKYSETGPDILKDISFDIIKGTSVAFIGQSGAGKTTLADVILGLLKPYEGDVTVGGKSIFTSPKSWAGIVGFVPQSVYLLSLIHIYLSDSRSNCMFW